MRYYPRGDYQGYDAIVLANGAFPSAAAPLAVLQHWLKHRDEVLLACCDGAVNNLQGYTEELPDVVIGDLDSVHDSLRHRLADRIIHITEQETNDLTKTMTYISQERGVRRVVLLGATGKREDHTLGNLSLLPSYAALVDELIVLTDTGYFRLITSDSAIEVGLGSQLSIFNFAQTPISLSGVHWPLEQRTLAALWAGTLNRADEDTIIIRTDSPLLLFVAY